MFLSQNRSEKQVKGVFHMVLHPEKFLITVILYNFGKQPNTMIFVFELLDTVEENNRPFNDEGAETVLLIEIREDILLHSLPWHPTFQALLIKLNLLNLNIRD